MHVTGDPKGYYRILAVPRNASPEAIRAAFRERAKLFHPDHGGEMADDRRFRLLREAYEVLRDPQRRLQYDADGLRPPPRSSATPPRQPKAARPGRSYDFQRGRSHMRPVVRPWRIRLSASTLLMSALGAVLVVVMALWWSTVRQLELRNIQVSQLSYRLSEAGRADAQSRVRDDAVAARGLDQAASSDKIGELDDLYSTYIDFAAGQTQLDDRLEGLLRQAITTLAPAIKRIPEDRQWVIQVDGHAVRSVSPRGVEAAAWESVLLRIGAVVNYLAQAGLPPQRLASRFEAGPQDTDPSLKDGRVVRVRLRCCVVPMGGQQDSITDRAPPDPSR